VGIDLGGARGKTTAIAELAITEGGVHARSATTRSMPGAQPWQDTALWTYLSSLGEQTVVAIDAPLTQPSCLRCTRPVCPGVADCVEPAVVWLRTEGERLVAGETLLRGDVGGGAVASPPTARPRVRLQPYAHRATEVVLGYERGLIPTSSVGTAVGPIAARAGHLRRRLAGCGFQLNENLLEVSPVATLTALFGGRRARATRRDGDAWAARAWILEQLGELSFAPTSRFAREDALRSDHVFGAVIAAYTAYLWARDGWRLPGPREIFDDDGWIWTP
jgi:hypothetical protein